MIGCNNRPDCLCDLCDGLVREIRRLAKEAKEKEKAATSDELAAAQDVPKLEARMRLNDSITS